MQVQVPVEQTQGNQVVQTTFVVLSPPPQTTQRCSKKAITTMGSLQIIMGVLAIAFNVSIQKIVLTIAVKLAMELFLFSIHM